VAVAPWGGEEEEVTLRRKLLFVCPFCTEVSQVLDTVLNSTCQLLGLWENAKEKRCCYIKQCNKQNALYTSTYLIYLNITTYFGHRPSVRILFIKIGLKQLRSLLIQNLPISINSTFFRYTSILNLNKHYWCITTHYCSVNKHNPSSLNLIQKI
jgi:hypothetical protein